MKSKIMMLALVAMTTGVAIHAESAPCAATSTEAAATKLSADELAFAAKLSDQNRKTFAEKFIAEQRKAIQVAVKNGANPDEAVQKMFAAISVKEGAAVAQAEASEAEKSAQ